LRLGRGTFKQDPLDGLGVKQQDPLGLHVGDSPGLGFSAKPPHGHAESSGHWSDWQELGLSNHALHCSHNEWA
jgi:hypothetical protein